MIRSLLILLFGVAVPSSEFPVPAVPIHRGSANWELGTENSHDLHLSHTRMVVEGKTVACRIRVFRDDLQLALRQFSRQPNLEVTLSARADSLFAAYFGVTVRLTTDGQPLALRVTASGGEVDPATQEVIWYVLQGEAGRPVTRLTLLQALMFELHHDQQNIVLLLRLPGERRQTLYFAAMDPREQSLQF